MSPASRWRIALGVVAAACAAVTLPMSPLADRAQGQGEDSGFTVEATPTSLLTDGQPISVVIRSTREEPVFGAEMRLCRAGVTYQPSSKIRPNEDFELGGPNCPPSPITSSADYSITDSNTYDNVATPDGSRSRYRVGAGTTNWTARDKTPTSLTCGPNDPCALVVEVNGNKGWVPFVLELSFRDDDPVQGCGGPADGILLSGASDRMADAWVNWTLDDCKKPGRTGASTRAVFTGEGAAVESYNDEGLDLVYSAAGFDSKQALLAADVEQRPSIAVPVAVNAAVLAVAGGRRNDTGVKVPYRDIRLTLEEVAALFSGGPASIQKHYSDIFKRNPELDQTGFFDTKGAGFLVAAPSEAESTSWVFTNHLASTVPSSWVVPDTPVFGADRLHPRGADAYLALAEPTFAPALSLLTGRPSLRKGLDNQALDPYATGGVWVLTDRETATALDMTFVQIAAQPGAATDPTATYLMPTDAAVLAGVSTMNPGDAGTLLPNPSEVAPVGGVTPYPLAFVEYAIVPAEPLVDAACTPREASQKLLKSWLTYLIGDGQSALPPGMLPLPASLKAQAVAAIDKVGATASTAGCEEEAATPPTTTPPPTVEGVTTTPLPAPSAPSVVAAPRSRPVPAVPATEVTPAPTPSEDSTGEEAVALPAVPAFAGRAPVGWTGTAISLVGITALSALAALAASGRLRRRPRVGLGRSTR